MTLFLLAHLLAFELSLSIAAFLTSLHFAMPVSATTSITMTGSKAISTKQRSRFKGGKSKNDLRQKDQRETRDQSIAAIREVLEDVLTKSPAEFDWDHSGQNGPLEEIERQRAFEKAMKGWPWRTELVPDRVLTQAPHAMNEYNYDNVCSLAQVKQVGTQDAGLPPFKLNTSDIFAF